MRIVFMGTPEFAVPCLEILINRKYEISAVVTQPDKPCGRGKKLTPPPVKTFALEKGIKVLQPKSVRTQEFEDQLKELSPDLAVVVAYGKILPLNVLNLPKFGCINIHASLLPYYRGAAPINWAIIKGEKVTGVTSMFMDEGMDTGD
ncbi:MAG: methionyl-tRNA formyltransferase, partial [Eubacteriales bacterium]|nr:methionyl-tRNA formyltransferase [Eubacteriales bacterium]